MAKKKSRQQNKRGTVAVSWRNGWARFRLRFEQKDYGFSPGIKETPIGREKARRLAIEVEGDMLDKTFDTSLAKYKGQKTEEPIVTPPTTIELWEKFTDHRRQLGTSEESIKNRYRPIASNLAKFGKDIDSNLSALEFINHLRSKQSPRIANQNLSLLRGFAVWSIEQGHLEANYFKAIVALKVPNRIPDEIFEKEDIHRMVEATMHDPVLLNYRDFIQFLLYSGCRPSEAIGIRWEHVNFRRNEIHICESLSRSAEGGRVRNGTKSHSRFIPMSEGIRTVLEGRSNGQNVEGLVFTSPRGKPIDDSNFSQRIWRRLCEKSGIPHRRPYNTRHSVSNHMLDGGATFHQVAYTLGNSARMISDTYGHKRQGAKLPEF